MAFAAAVPIISALITAGASIYSANKSSKDRASMGSSSKKIQKLPTQDKYQQKLAKDLYKSIHGKDYNFERNPDYMNALEQMRGASRYANDLMSPDSQAYQNFKKPMMTEYQEEILPNLKERFNQLGLRGSSSFENALAQSGQSLEERLAALRTGLQQQGATMQSQFAGQQANMAMNPYNAQMQRASLALGQKPFGYMQPGASSPTFLESVMPTIGQIGGSYLGSDSGSKWLTDLFKGSSSPSASPYGAQQMWKDSMI